MEKKLKLSTVGHSQLVGSCVTCAPPDVVGVTSACNKSTKKGGFKRLIALSCKVLLPNRSDIATLLSGGTAQVWTGAAYEAKTLQEIIDLKLGAVVMDTVTGSMTTGNTSTQKLASCLPEQVTNKTWNFSIATKVFDNSGAYLDCDALDALVTNVDYHHLVLEGCDNPTEAYVLTAKSWSLADVTKEIPEDGVNEVQMAGIVASIQQLTPPCAIPAPILDSVTFP